MFQTKKQLRTQLRQVVIEFADLEWKHARALALAHRAERAAVAAHERTRAKLATSNESLCEVASMADFHFGELIAAQGRIDLIKSELLGMVETDA